MQQAIVFGVIAATLVMFLGRWVRYDLVALGGLLILALTGIIPGKDVFGGFANPAVITIAAVLVMAGALWNAGVVDLLASLLGRVVGGPTSQLMALTGSVAFCSALINDTGAVGIFMPVALQLARRHETSPSRFLMPIACSAFLGGLTTMIGTPPNIIIAAYRTHTGHPAFGMFAFTPVGVAVALAGLVFMWLAARFLVPERRSGKEADRLLGMARYLTEARVGEGSDFVGRPLGALDGVADADFAVVGLVRGNRTLPPARYEILHVGDGLLIEADAENLKTVLDAAKLDLAESKEVAERFLVSKQIDVTECVVGAGARVIGRSAASLSLRRWFGVNLLAVARQGERIEGRLSDVRLRAGDVLLLQGDAEVLDAVAARLGCLPLAERSLRLGKPTRVASALGIFVLAIAAASSGLVATDVAFIAGALVMVLAGLIQPREIYDTIEWPVIVLLGAIIPVGGALQRTGGAASIAHAIVAMSYHMPPAAIVGLLLLGTLVLSNIVNHAATAVLMAPIAAAVARGMDVSADPMLMAVAVGASLPMLLPTGHPCNVLVMGPGGYRFGDYWRLGLPLSLLAAAVAVPMLLLVWPLALHR